MTEPEEPFNSEPQEPEEPSSPESQQPQMSLEERRRCINALEALSKREVHKLHSYARFKMATVRGRISTEDADDLLQDAITRTLEGRRKWNHEKIDFVTHLRGCMRSIAHERLERAYRELEALEEWQRQSKEQFDNYLATDILDEIRFRIQADAIALQVFDRLLQGYKRAETCQALNMRADVYDAARKRISRYLYTFIPAWVRKDREERLSADKPSEHNA